MSEFKQGDRVSFIADNVNAKGKIFYNTDATAPFGEVVLVKENGKSIVVQWDKEFHWMTVKTCKVSQLMLESEFKPEYSRLETEFTIFESRVKSKMKEAGQLILEANQIAEEEGRDINFMWDALAPLEKAVNDHQHKAGGL